jgi:hypothetical protein
VPRHHDVGAASRSGNFINHASALGLVCENAFAFSTMTLVACCDLGNCPDGRPDIIVDSGAADQHARTYQSTPMGRANSGFRRNAGKSRNMEVRRRRVGSSQRCLRRLLRYCLGLWIRRSALSVQGWGSLTRVWTTYGSLLRLRLRRSGVTGVSRSEGTGRSAKARAASTGAEPRFAPALTAVLGVAPDDGFGATFR